MTFKHIPDRPQSLTAEYVTLRYKALTDRKGFAGKQLGWSGCFQVKP